MKILPIYFNSKNTKFCGNQYYPIDNWINDLTKNDELRIDDDAILKTNKLPTFNKPKFEYSDYESLSPEERQIIQILNRNEADKVCWFTHRKDLSIEKDAERILELASKAKEFLDRKYKNGYKLVGIGRSPETFIETMQLLGTDTTVIPFSKALMEIENNLEFPYERLVPNENDCNHKFSGRHYVHPEKCSVKDWEKYLQYYGIDKNFSKRTGKALLFTDYVYTRETKKYFESILNGLGFDNNYEFIDIMHLFNDVELQLDCNLPNCFHAESFKFYTKMKSPKHCYKEVDIIKHPEYIPSLPETLKSKLFRCALYDLLKSR